VLHYIVYNKIQIMCGIMSCKGEKRILFVQNNYPGFLKSLYDKYPNWKDLSYSQLKDNWSKELFGHSNFYSKHLNSLGWKTKEVIFNDTSMQSRWLKESGVVVKIPFLNSKKRIFWRQVEDFKPDIVYMHNFSILNVKDLKKLKKKTRLVVGQIACPLPANKEVLKQYDLIISSFPHYVEKFESWGINSEYLKWCFEGSITREIKSKKKKYDVVFIGGFSHHHSKGNKVMESLARNVRVDFWGYGVDSLPPLSLIRKTYHGQAWGKDMFKIFSQAKIVVNRHIGVSENIANNMRMFEVTGMSALLITDHKANLSDFFDVGKEVISYKDDKTLISSVKYYLKHDKERERVARLGQKRALKDHTYKVRMKELSKMLSKHLSNI
jgi:spore maturation protein CgeB